MLQSRCRPTELRATSIRANEPSSPGVLIIEDRVSPAIDRVLCVPSSCGTNVTATMANVAYLSIPAGRSPILFWRNPLCPRNLRRSPLSPLPWPLGGIRPPRADPAHRAGSTGRPSSPPCPCPSPWWSAPSPGSSRIRKRLPHLSNRRLWSRSLPRSNRPSPRPRRPLHPRRVRLVISETIPALHRSDRLVRIVDPLVLVEETPPPLRLLPLHRRPNGSHHPPPSSQRRRTSSVRPTGRRCCSSTTRRPRLIWLWNNTNCCS